MHSRLHWVVVSHHTQLMNENARAQLKIFAFVTLRAYATNTLYVGFSSRSATSAGSSFKSLRHTPQYCPCSFQFYLRRSPLRRRCTPPQSLPQYPRESSDPARCSLHIFRVHERLARRSVCSVWSRRLVRLSCAIQVEAANL